MNQDSFNPINNPGNVFQVIKATESKRDVPTVLEMMKELNYLLVEQVDLETCPDEIFKAAVLFINWRYSRDILGVTIGDEPEQPYFIQAIPKD